MNVFFTYFTFVKRIIAGTGYKIRFITFCSIHMNEKFSSGTINPK